MYAWDTVSTLMCQAGGAKSCSNGPLQESLYLTLNTIQCPEDFKKGTQVIWSRIFKYLKASPLLICIVN